MTRFLTTFAALAALALPATAQEFPLTIETKFGPTVIEERPERIATLDFNGADDLLAFGVQPVAIRYWYGDHPQTVWPWAAPLLTSEPVVIQREIDYEALAATEPDVILAMWSGIDQDAWDQLSQIAPVVAVPDGVGDYEMPWNDRAVLAGRAIGMETEALAAVADLDARFDAVSATHPDWGGLTASVAYLWNGRLGVYGSGDVRPQILARLGFGTPEAVDAMVPADRVAIDISNEVLHDIDADLILWFATGADFAPVRDLPGRDMLGGAEIFVDDLLTGAFSHASLLSLPYTIDRLVPAIATALDPATEAPVDLTESE